MFNGLFGIGREYKKLPPLMCRLLLVATSVMAMSVSATAAQMPTSYLCEGKNAYDLSDGGAIKRSANPMVRVGERFQINIKTGEMIGAGALSSQGWDTISVLDPGTSSSGSSLKVLYSSPADKRLYSSPSGDFTNAGYLQIQGTIEQPSRPFIYKWSFELFSGVCSAAF
jgi:hypothetical protein